MGWRHLRFLVRGSRLVHGVHLREWAADGSLRTMARLGHGIGSVPLFIHASSTSLHFTRYSWPLCADDLELISLGEHAVICTYSSPTLFLSVCYLNH